MDMDKAVEFLVENAARHESQLQAIRKLIQGGMKLVVSSQAKTNGKLTDVDRKLNALVEAQVRTEASIDRLVETQRVTEKKLQALIQSLTKSKNGHKAR